MERKHEKPVCIVMFINETSGKSEENKKETPNKIYFHQVCKRLRVASKTPSTKSLFENVKIQKHAT